MKLGNASKIAKEQVILPRVTGRSRLVASVRHFLRHFASFLDMQARDGRREGGGEGKSLTSDFRQNSPKKCGECVEGSLPHHTVFSIRNAPRVEFSAGVLMLTNYCQLLYLIPRLSLSPLSSSALPSLHINRHLLEEVEKCFILDHRRQTCVNAETYRLQRIFYS